MNMAMPEKAQSLQNMFTSADLVGACLTRIDAVDRAYNSIIETNPDALSIAQALDKEPYSRGPLHGIPILLKDNIPTLDLMSTACGSLALVGARPRNEAAVVTSLRNAGAVILGKANMAEWSGFRSTSGCSGWSARGGQTRGIFYPNSKASGSSGGCAVATSLGLCFAAIGTETVYSIVSPAERSGIIGFKPTRSLISSEGIIFASHRQDTVGILTRTVSDILLVLSGIILQSTYLAPSTIRKVSLDLNNACSNLDLSGIRMGILDNLSELKNVHATKTTAFESILTLLRNSGAEIVRNMQISGAQRYENLSQKERQIVLDTDMKIAINSYLASLATNPNGTHNLKDLIEFTKNCPEEEYPQRNVEGLERAQATDPEGELYKRMVAQDAYFTGEGGIEAALNRYKCDILLIPSLSVTLQTFAAKAGSPVMSVPVGSYPQNTPVEKDPKNGLVDKSPGMPFSAYIFGRAGRDETVLKMGYVIEQLTKTRDKLQPYFELKTEPWDGETCSGLSKTDQHFKN